MRLKTNPAVFGMLLSAGAKSNVVNDDQEPKDSGHIGPESKRRKEGGELCDHGTMGEKFPAAKPKCAGKQRFRELLTVFPGFLPSYVCQVVSAA